MLLGHSVETQGCQNGEAVGARRSPAAGLPPAPAEPSGRAGAAAAAAAARR